MLTVNQAYNLLVKDKESDFNYIDEYGDYYFDNPVQKIRYIVLSCDAWCFIPIMVVQSVITYMATVPEGYNIVVLSHLSMHQRTAQQDYVTSPDNYGMRALSKAMSALNNRENFSYTETTISEYDTSVPAGTTSYTYEADYTNSKAKAFAIIGGHVHQDIDLAHPYPGGWQYPYVQMVTTTCDAIGKQHYTEGITDYTRNSGTISEQAFDVIHLDIKNNVIYTKRIGAGYDRIYHTDVKTVAQGSTLTLTSMLTGTLTWSVHRDAIITVSNGVVAGVRNDLGAGFVAATDENGNREIFIIKVS
jgi:hypothetical protein